MLIRENMKKVLEDNKGKYLVCKYKCLTYFPDGSCDEVTRPAFYLQEKCKVLNDEYETYFAYDAETFELLRFKEGQGLEIIP